MISINNQESPSSNEKTLYKQLGVLTGDKDQWYSSIGYVGSLLNHPSLKIKAKVLWLLGEFGLKYPEEITPYLDPIAEFKRSEFLNSRTCS